MTDYPDHALLPVTSFRAFHGNYTGIQRTGEMKLSLIVPPEDINDAMTVARDARDEILVVRVYKLDPTVGLDDLADIIAEQERERAELARQNEDVGNELHDELTFGDD